MSIYCYFGGQAQNFYTDINDMEESSAYIISGTIGSRSIAANSSEMVNKSSSILAFFLLKAQNPEEFVDMSVFLAVLQ